MLSSSHLNIRDLFTLEEVMDSVGLSDWELLEILEDQQIEIHDHNGRQFLLDIDVQRILTSRNNNVHENKI